MSGEERAQHGSVSETWRERRVSTHTSTRDWGVMMRDRDDEKSRLERRIAGVGCCRESAATSEMSTSRGPQRANQEVSVSTIIRTLILLVVAAILPSAAWAQVTLAGTVKDTSGAVL